MRLQIQHILQIQRFLLQYYPLSIQFYWQSTINTLLILPISLVHFFLLDLGIILIILNISNFLIFLIYYSYCPAVILSSCSFWVIMLLSLPLFSKFCSLFLIIYYYIFFISSLSLCHSLVFLIFKLLLRTFL